jgi:hypothetical protein
VVSKEKVKGKQGWRREGEGFTEEVGGVVE